MSDPLLPHSRRPADVLLPFLILRSPRTELRLISNDPHLRWLSPPISNPSHATVKKNPTRCRHCRTPPFHPAPHRKPETRKDTLAPPTSDTCYVVAHEPQLPSYRRGGQGSISGPRVGQAPHVSVQYTKRFRGVTEASTHY
jgi:hypothetical protein